MRGDLWPWIGEARTTSVGGRAIGAARDVGWGPNSAAIAGSEFTWQSRRMLDRWSIMIRGILFRISFEVAWLEEDGVVSISAVELMNCNSWASFKVRLGF